MVFDPSQPLIEHIDSIKRNKLSPNDPCGRIDLPPIRFRPHHPRDPMENHKIVNDAGNLADCCNVKRYWLVNALTKKG
jgi:hypothetical protein